jgi:glycolate oxidase
MSPTPNPTGDRLAPGTFGLAAVAAADVDALRGALGEEAVLADAERMESYARDETEAMRFPPDVVVLPRTVEQVQAALRIAHERRLPVVARGGGSGLSGGALAVCGGIVLGLERLNRIREIDERDLVAEVESGVVLADLQTRVESLGLLYPPDPASRESCLLGGNLAEDSAGPRSCRHGTTRKWVLGLECVLADGTLLSTGSRCRKDATGYDLTQLLVGSEGTLAVITAATLRLIAKPKATLTAIAPFPTLESAASAVERIFAEGVDPTACELMERAALAAVAKVEPVPPELADREAMILIELDGDDDESLLPRAARFEEVAIAAGGGEALVATDAAGQRRLWQVRRAIGSAVKHTSFYKEADTVVPRSKLAELVAAARAAAARHGLVAVIYGHAGDGNLHVNLLRGELADGLWEERRDAAEEELFRATVALGGRITGEHGVGWTQRRFLPLALSAREIELLAGVKRLFDPRGILNPGKILP